MPVHETLDTIGSGLAQMEVPPELVIHEALTPLGEGLKGVASRLEALSEGVLRISTGDGADLPAVPAITIAHPGRGKIHYLALPEGPEEAPFVRALTASEVQDPKLRSKVQGLEVPAEIMVFIASACPHCPKAVAAANSIALMSPAITTIIVDAQHHASLAEKFGIKSVPFTLLDRGLSITGVTTAADLVERLVRRGSDEEGAKVITSLIEQERLEEAVELIREQGGTNLFITGWKTSSLSSRIGFMILVEAALQEDERALDECVPALIGILESEDAALRGDTADVLGQIGHPSAVPALEKLKDDKNPDVAEIAAEAIEEIADRMD